MMIELTVSAAVLISSISIVSVASLAAVRTPPGSAPGEPPPPAAATNGELKEAERRPVTDRYFDVVVRDDYRWLEDALDPEVGEWSEAQNARARAILDALPGYSEIAKRAQAIAHHRSPAYSLLQRRGRTLFAIKAEPPRQQPFLVVLRSADDTLSERIVADPNAIDAKGGTAIDFFVPSRDGRLVAVSLSEGGSEAGDVVVFETATGKRLPDRVPRVNGGTAGGDVAWNADATGFFYTRYPRAKERPEADLEFYQQVYFHRLGQPAERDTYVTGKELPRIAEITLDASDDARFFVAAVKNGDGGEVSHYFRSPAGGWSLLASDADRVVETRFSPDGSLFLLSRKGASRGRILRLAPGATVLAEAAVVVPEGDGSIDDFVVTARRIFISELVAGLARVRVLARDGSPVADVPLLPHSAVSGLLVSAGDEAMFENQSFLEPPVWYRAAADGSVTRTGLARSSPVDFSDCEVVREWAVSRDGARVPIDVFRRKGTRLDGANPTLLHGYGGYAIAQRPTYAPIRRIWLDQGGVYAVAGIRGGGEFGDDWHLAGRLTQKQNVFDDFAAAARRLVEIGYTRPPRLAIEGGSNGGLLMGAMLTQHPELFGAVVSHVGIYDMLRVERSPNGAFNVTEFGTVKDPEQFRALYAYSPYHRVADGKRYPPVLMLTGANDPRVDPMQSRKMIARLQSAGAEGSLLRTSASSGHGRGSSLDEKTAQAADVYAFLFDRLGVRYRPVRSP